MTVVALDTRRREKIGATHAMDSRDGGLMKAPAIDRYHVCTSCAHAETRKRRWSRCPSCGSTGSLEISGPGALHGMFLSIDRIRTAV